MNERRDRVTFPELLVQAVLLAALLGILFPAVFLRGEMAVPGTILYEVDPWRQDAPPDYRPARNNVTLESLTQFVPWYTLTQETLRQGHWPLWNPLQYTGQPLLGNFQSAVLYPLHVLHVFLNVYVAMTIYALVKLWLCGFMAYVCGRGMGFSPGVSRFLSVAWMLSGFNIIWCYWPLPDVTAWLPLFFLGTEFIVQRRFRRGFFISAVAAVLLLLAGHPETAFAMCLMVGVYFFLRLGLEGRQRGSLWQPVAVAGSVWVVALLVCAAQLAPFLEFLANSSTFVGRADPEMEKFFIPGKAFVALWVPRFCGATPDAYFASVRNSNYVSIVYAGIATWVGASLLFCGGPWRKRDGNRAIAVAVASLLSLLLAFGLVPPLTGLPLFSSMRGLYHVTFAMWGLPLLAALGIERWTAKPRRLRQLLGSAPALLLIGAVVWGLYAIDRPVLRMSDAQDYVLEQILVAVLLALLCLIVLALSCLWRRPRLCVALLTILLAGDLLYAARNFLPTAPRDQIFPETELTTFLQNQGHPVRVSVGSTPIATGVLSAYDLEQQWGYDGMFAGRFMTFSRELHPTAWERVEPLCSIELYLHTPGTSAPETNEAFEYVDTISGVEVHRNRRALPRAFLVGQVRAVAGKEELFETLRSADFNYTRIALTEAPPEEALPCSTSDDLGAAVVTEWDATHACVEVVAKDRCGLVLTDAFFPGWHVRIDGNPAELFPAYYAFRGVVVPEGNHTVEFEYRPWSFRLGMAVSVCTMLIAIGAGVWMLRRVRT